MATREYRGTPDGFDSAWREPTPAEMPPGYPAMVEALRVFQDAFAGAVPPDDLVAAVTSDLTRLTAELNRHQVPEHEQLAGRLPAQPGRGQAMAPALYVEEHSPNYVRGHVTFGRFFVGGNGAAHGGAIALIFDEMMGGWPTPSAAPRARPTCTSTTAASPRWAGCSTPRRGSNGKRDASATYTPPCATAS